MFSRRMALGLVGFVVALGMALALLTAHSGRSSQAAPTDDVCGPINSNTTWTTAGSPYVVTCDVQVLSGVTLIIQSGVVVKFNATTSLLVDGTLIAPGATFTSNDPTPAQDDWGRIFFSSSSVDATFDGDGHYLSGSLIQDCLVEWGGGGTGVNGAIETSTASPFIDHNTIRNNGASGVYALGRSASQPVVISRNSIHNNSSGPAGGAYVSAGEVVSNTVTNNTCACYGGGVHAIASTVTGNTVSHNDTFVGYGDGGGIYAQGGRLSGNMVSQNATKGSGGGIYTSGGLVFDNEINNNFANSSGGGVFATGGGSVSGNTVNGNTANLGGGIYATGAVTGNLLRGNSGLDGGAVFSSGGAVISNTIVDNTTTRNGTLFMAGGTATENLIEGNSAGNSGGGIYGNVATLAGNTVQGNTANLGGGIYVTNSTVNGNSVSGNTAQSDGGGLYAVGGTVTANRVSENTVPAFGRGSGVYLSGNPSFSTNSVLTNTAPGGTAGGISISGQPQVHYNNLHGNAPYDAEVVSSANVSGTLNYWGPSPCTAIPAQIYDGDDAPGRGELHYAPSLYLPVPLAQLPAPTNLIIVTGTVPATLTWLPIPPIPDIGCRDPGSSAADWGYLVYYDTEGPCPPFRGSGMASGDSPVDVGQATELALYGLADDRHYFTVTAYDYLGRESIFSNVAVSLSPHGNLYLPLVLKSS